MKKAEIVLGAIAVVALMLNLLFVPGGSVLTVLSLLAISVLYMYLSFALFNGVRLRHIFKKESYKGISSMRIIGAVLTGLALSITLIGLLFKFQDWPGATINLGVGLFGLVIALIVGAVKYSKLKSDYYTKIFKRIAVYGGLGLIMLLLPKEAWLEFRYRNHPDYVKAVKKSYGGIGQPRIMGQSGRGKTKNEYRKMKSTCANTAFGCRRGMCLKQGHWLSTHYFSGRRYNVF